MIYHPISNCNKVNFCALNPDFSENENIINHYFAKVKTILIKSDLVQLRTNITLNTQFPQFLSLFGCFYKFCETLIHQTTSTSDCIVPFSVWRCPHQEI